MIGSGKWPYAKVISADLTRSERRQMGWLVGAVVVLAIIYFMILSPGFRLLVISLLILAGVGIYVFIVNANKQSEAYRQQQAEARQQQAEAERVRLQQQAEAERWATTAIRSDELLLTDVSLNHDYSGWKLKGTVTNNSKAALGSISFLVTITDCSISVQCKIIGQENTATRTTYHLSGLFDDITPNGAVSPLSSSAPRSVLDVLVPPGQVRLFETNEMAFRNMPPSSNSRWTYKVTEIRAVR